MKQNSLHTGFSFGLASGVITTLGLLIGLAFGTSNKLVVLGGILTIAISDALSDAFGVHISQESQAEHSSSDIWKSTISTFLSKLFFAGAFIIPVAMFDLWTAMFVSVIWGYLLIITFSCYLGKLQKTNMLSVVAEHVAVMTVVIILSYAVGVFVSKYL